MKDPLLTFSEALSVGSDWDFGLDIDEILRGSPPPLPHIGFDFFFSTNFSFPSLNLYYYSLRRSFKGIDIVFGYMLCFIFRQVKM